MEKRKESEKKARKARKKERKKREKRREKRREKVLPSPVTLFLLRLAASLPANGCRQTVVSSLFFRAIQSKHGKIKKQTNA